LYHRISVLEDYVDTLADYVEKVKPGGIPLARVPKWRSALAALGLDKEKIMRHVSAPVTSFCFEHP
jgi:hypothetical protein